MTVASTKGARARPLPAVTRCPLCHEHCPDIQDQAKKPGTWRQLCIDVRDLCGKPSVPVLCISNDEVIGWTDEAGAA